MSMKGEVIHLIQHSEDEYQVSSLVNRTEPMLWSYLNKRKVDELIKQTKKFGLKVIIKGREQ